MNQHKAASFLSFLAVAALSLVAAVDTCAVAAQVAGQIQPVGGTAGNTGVLILGLIAIVIVPMLFWWIVFSVVWRAGDGDPHYAARWAWVVAWVSICAYFEFVLRPYLGVGQGLFPSSNWYYGIYGGTIIAFAVLLFSQVPGRES